MDSRGLVVLLVVTCVGSVPLPECEELLKPLGLDDHSMIYGKWYLIISASDSLHFRVRHISVKSSWIDVRPTEDATVLLLRWGERIDGTCSYGTTKVTISANPSSCLKFTSYSTKREGYYLKPCPNCLLWIDTVHESGQTGKNIDMYSRTPELESLHLKSFLNHTACLNFPEAYTSYDGVTEVCSDNKDPDLCDDLPKPQALQDLTHIYGKWIYVIGVSDHSKSQYSPEGTQSSWIEVSPTTDSTDLTLRWGERIDGECKHGSATVVVEEQGSNRSSLEYSRSDVSYPRNGTFLQPCPDCLLWRETSTVLDVPTRLLFLFRRTAKLDKFHLDMFRTHATCLTFPQTYNSYDGVTELCPEERPK
ncbi:uncharacterized protein [Osmerus mordax]|uniref:uncharacterized protein n=1 Tax=Osmerus mordax TaxID=8014 RepID=UPI00350EC6A0